MLEKLNDRKKAIDAIFFLVSSVAKLTDVNVETKAFLMQAATAARYDCEIYRGTFKLPVGIFEYLVFQVPKEDRQQFIKYEYYPNTFKQGIIVEGACATGECLNQLEQTILSYNRNTFAPCIGQGFDPKLINLGISSGFYLGVDISGNMIRTAQRRYGFLKRNTKLKKLFVQGDICNLPLREGSASLYVLNNVFDRVVDPSMACREADFILKREGSNFVLSNCDPLQFAYTTEEGVNIVFVPPEKQLSLKEGLKMAGFNPSYEENGVWKLETVAYGKEALPYLSLVGER
ncbi:class I SAM-dependent methyltransferase [Candidatus Woesearchaeota archaeon]|nr:class I SAM-dependent methyltransferase [Candidatus Woesearchaeota archaeon]